MRPKVPDDADIGLMQPEVHAARGDEVDLPQLAIIDQTLDRGDGGAVEERVARHQDEAALIGSLGQLYDLLRRRSQRLLDENVLPRVERCHREREVSGNRSRDRHRVERLVLQHLLEVHRAGDPRIATRDHLQCV